MPDARAANAKPPDAEAEDADAADAVTTTLPAIADLVASGGLWMCADAAHAKHPYTNIRNATAK